MNVSDLRHQRMHNQRLTGRPFATPEEMVRWHLAVQAQDYAGAKWGISQRCDWVDDAEVGRLFNAGAILRTHVMRPTWHFVMPEDIRWLLELTGPRVNAGNAGRYRQLGLDDATLARSDTLLANALAGGVSLTRTELAERLETGGISTEGQRTGYMLMHAELAGLICSGPRKGKQFTYTLLEERVPQAPTMDREEALAELTRRYVESHGPATPHDLAWWSGLTVTDARRGIEMHRDRLESITIDGTTWWRFPPAASPSPPEPVVHLLPAFDEYFIGFKQHQVAWDPELRRRYDSSRELWAANLVALNGSIIGGWRRKATSKEVHIATTSPLDLTPAACDAFHAAIEEYGRFLGLTAVVE